MHIHPPKIGIHQEFAQFMGSNDDVMGVQWGHDEPGGDHKNLNWDVMDIL